ncbi:hypothetical protein [Ruminococcus sp.]
MDHKNVAMSRQHLWEVSPTGAACFSPQRGKEMLHKARGKRWEFSEYCHDFRKTTQQRRFFHSQFVKNEVPFLVVLPKSRQISCAVFTLSG